MSALPILDDDELQKIYVWVDSIPLSRPKRNISRDFSDGVLVAEVVHHYFPKLVELHNYSAANSLRQKLYNWGTLNTKVFRRLGGFEVKRGDVEAIVNCKPGVIEAVLMQLQQKMAEYRAGKRSDGGGSGESGYGSPSAAAAGGRAGSVAGVGGGDYMDSAHTISQYAAGGGGGDQPLAQPSSSAQQQQPSSEANLELMEMIEVLGLKIKKLEQLVALKDNRIATLQARLAAASGQQQ